MPSINMGKYDYYIFDCDGVIMDSNRLKIDAMRTVLLMLNVNSDETQQCCDYFSQNFGKSRFHHVDVFIEKIITLDDEQKGKFSDLLLSLFSKQCQSLYLKANLTPGFIDFISQLDGEKFIASGSEQNELRFVFQQRNLDHHFSGIFGSPTKKHKLVEKIIQSKLSNRTVMVGDALSDLQAAQMNQIDFIGYTPFSNVPQQLIEQAQAAGYHTIKSWSQLKDITK
jgi:phosphoglycolate phosphatase-like HAD superfamily hydrolase